MKARECLSGLSVMCLPGASQCSYDLLASERSSSTVRRSSDSGLGTRDGLLDAAHWSPGSLVAPLKGFLRHISASSSCNETERERVYHALLEATSLLQTLSSFVPGFYDQYI